MARPLAVILLFDPLRHEARAQVDVHLARAIAACPESVRLASWNHDHLPGADLDLPVGAPEGRLTLEHDEDLGVVVLMQRGAAAGGSFHQEEGQAHVLVVRALKPE